MARTLKQLQKHPKVEIVDDERLIGNGIIVSLFDGWTIDPGDPRASVFGEDTVADCFKTLERAVRYTPTS